MKSLCFAFLLIILVPFVQAVEATDPGLSDTAPSQQVPSDENVPLKRFPHVLGRNLTFNLFDRGNLLPFLTGAAGAMAIAPADQEISLAMRDHAREFGDAGNVLGTVVPLSIIGGTFLGGRISQNDHFRSFSYTIAQASAINFTLTQGIKLATSRMRPDGLDSNSFLSGHTSSLFALAPVVEEYYGKKWGIPLYTLAGLIAVVAGAALGYISGKTALRGTKRELSGKKTFRLLIMPAYGRDSQGISVYLIY